MVEANLKVDLIHSKEEIDKNAIETIKRKQEIAAEVIYFLYNYF
jgi:hypothetical protein